MRWLIPCMLVLAACRTPPLPSGDGGGATAPDLAFAPPADLSLTPPGDLGFPGSTGDMCLGGCPVSCPAGAWCIFLNRGDCSTWACMLPQGSCGKGAPTCACAGGDKFCQSFARSGETFTCVDQTPFGWCAQPGFGDLTCQSSILCI